MEKCYVLVDYIDNSVKGFSEQLDINILKVFENKEDAIIYIKKEGMDVSCSILDIDYVKNGVNNG